PQDAAVDSVMVRHVVEECPGGLRELVALEAWQARLHLLPEETILGKSLKPKEATRDLEHVIGSHLLRAQRVEPAAQEAETTSYLRLLLEKSFELLTCFGRREIVPIGLEEVQQSEELLLALAGWERAEQ